MELAGRVRSEVVALWARLLAQEQVAAHVVEEFRDEAILPEVWKSLIAEARSRLDKIRTDADPLLGPIALPDADEATTASLSAAIRNHEVW